MIALYRDKTFVSVFALLFAVLILHFHIFIHPIKIYIPQNSGLLSLIFNKFLTNLPSFIITILYTVIIFFQALRFNLIMNNSKMFGKQNYTLGFAYIFLTAIVPNSYFFSVVLINNSIIIFIISLIFKLYNNTTAKGLIFNVGFLTSFSVICYYPSIILVLLSLIGLAVLRPVRLAEWFVMLLGFVAPFYILFSILYLTNFNFNNIILNKVSFLINLNSKNYWSVYTICFIILLLLLSLIIWYPNSNKLVIQMRKNWIILLFFLIISIVAIPFYTKLKYQNEVLMIIPLASFLANFFTYPKKTLLINLILMLSISIIIYNNFNI